MKKLVLILLLLCGLRLSAQNYDLIVTTNGDSIACHIDSITDTQVYFEMIINDGWVHKITPKSDCINYEFNKIDKRVVTFKSGSSYIDKISTSKLQSHYYDLIVTTEGDSIACRIDSITDTKIYFEMKVNDHWIHTNNTLKKVSDYKYDAINKSLVIFKSGTSYIKELRKPTYYSDRSTYANRYMFAPSAFGIKKEVNSYTTYAFLLQDFQFGISERFSMGLGTTIFFIPIYFMPTYTYQINDKSAFAIGDLLMFSPYKDFTYFGNLFYGLYTRGSLDNNFSVGVGLWTATETDIGTKSISPAFNISASIKTAENTYFLTENYYVQMNSDNGAYYEMYDPVNDIYIHEHKNFNQETTIIGGISGFRFISKRNPQNSWQLGLIYIFVYYGEVPDEYKQPGWGVHVEENSVEFLGIPILSYSRKF